MHFDLGSHMRSRSRSAQLEKTLSSITGMGSMSLSDNKRARPTLPAPRSAGPLTENTNISNVGGSLRGVPGQAQAPRPSEPMVHFDEEPPKMLPAIPMTNGELYSESGGEDDIETEIGNGPENENENLDENHEIRNGETEDTENENEDEVPEPLVLTC